MKINKVGILGMGAIGGLLAAQIYDYNPQSVYILGEQKRIKRYQDEGWITVNGKDYDFTGLSPEASQTLDLIILSVKYHHLEKAIPLMKPFMNENTIIISLMNGIDTENEIGAVYGMEKLLYSFIVEISAVKKGKKITANKGKIVFNSLIPNDKKVMALSEFFNRTQIVYEIADDIMKEIWWKFMINVGVNQVSAVLDAPYGKCQKIDEIRELMDGAMKEVIALSKLEGANLTREDLMRWYPILDALNPDGMTSMLQDMRGKRKTEVEMFAGVVSRLGKKHKLPTPVNDILYQLIKAKEEIIANQTLID